MRVLGDLSIRAILGLVGGLLYISAGRHSKAEHPD